MTIVRAALLGWGAVMFGGLPGAILGIQSARYFWGDPTQGVFWRGAVVGLPFVLVFVFLILARAHFPANAKPAAYTLLWIVGASFFSLLVVGSLGGAVVGPLEAELRGDAGWATNPIQRR